MIDESVVRRVLGAALRRGGDFAEVFAEDVRTTAARLEASRVEQVTTGRERGAGIRVVAGESTGFAHTADLTEAGLLAAAEAAAAAARNADEGAPSVDLRRTPTAPPDLAMPPEDVPKAAKVDLLTRADGVARSEAGTIRQVMASYGDSRRRVLVANSDGLLAEDDQTRVRFSVQCVAAGDTGMQTASEVIAATTGYEVLGDERVAEAATVAARRAVTKLNARPAPTGVLPVVLEQGSGGVMFHEACGHGLEADLVGKGASVYRGRLDDQVASPLVTLVDDGTVGGEWGAFGVDDEGHPATRNVLIENGGLADYMWDFLRSRKEGRESSGNGRRQSYRHLPMVRMTNTYLLPGDDDPDEIVAQTPHGLYVAKLGGGQVNTATGDFVFGIQEAYLIENGRVTETVRDANLIGNGPEVLRGIDAVGNDFAIMPGGCGKDGQTVPVGCGQPTLRIAGITVGGTAA